MLNIDNPKVYKKCSYKQHTCSICMPPVGTVVINKVKHPNSVRILRNREYFTVSELQTLQQSGNPLYNTIMMCIRNGEAEMVSQQKPFVIAGVLGELSCIAADKLASQYRFSSDNSIINMATLQGKMRNNKLDWTQVTFIDTNTTYWACFLDKDEIYNTQVRTIYGVETINDRYTNHGKGDFIVAKGSFSTPDLSTRFLVNGIVFANEFNNKGWTDYISTHAVDIKSSMLPLLLDNLKFEDGASIDKEVDKNNHFDKWRSSAESLAMKIISIYIGFTKDTVVASKIENTKSGSEGNYISGADYGYVCFKASFKLANNSIVEVGLKYMDVGYDYGYVDIHLKDNNHDAYLNYGRTAYGEKGVRTDYLSESQLVDFVAKTLGIQLQQAHPQAQSKAKNFLDSFFKR